MLWLGVVFASLPAILAFSSDFGIDSPRGSLAQKVNMWKLRKANQLQTQGRRPFVVQENAPVANGPFDEFEERWFEQPVDHFSSKNNATFLQRYWINTRHYDVEEGGPVFVLDGGETSGYGRLPFLDTGIMDILSKATGGIGIVLEHRYYGKSVPVPDFTTDNLRWLNNEQSAEDSANFMRNVQFKGIKRDITAPGTPWIYYGGSYAGARAAHMRILYPDIVYGAIASSAVTHAFIDYWEYMDTIRVSAEPTCMKNVAESIVAIDRILDTGNPTIIRLLKGMFGLAELQDDADFASILSSPLGYWQSGNWDPSINSGGVLFDEFCDSLTGASGLDGNDSFAALVNVSPITVPVTVYRYANYIRTMVEEECASRNVEECFGTSDATKFLETDLHQTWRLWIWQVCTQWGYFFVAPPADQPTIVSRQHTLSYETQICRSAFPPGNYASVPALPNVTAVNALGDFGLAADRLAFIDGEVDPWKPATPHSRYAKPRRNTRLRPFYEIPNGVHHWDENGLRDPTQEPYDIQRIHKQEIAFVKEWLANWKKPKN